MNTKATETQRTPFGTVWRGLFVLLVVFIVSYLLLTTVFASYLWVPSFYDLPPGLSGGGTPPLQTQCIKELGHGAAPNAPLLGQVLECRRPRNFISGMGGYYVRMDSGLVLVHEKDLIWQAAIMISAVLTAIVACILFVFFERLRKFANK